jgi:hypothetical protein
MEKKINISLLLESFHNLEKAYVDLKKASLFRQRRVVKNKPYPGQG